MLSLVNTLISTFLLVRDFFGYFLPGAVLFVSIALSIDVQRYFGDNFAVPTWLTKIDWAVIVVIAGFCYALGHLLAAIGYFILARFRATSTPDPNILYYRYRYPSLFIEHDRRDTVALFRVGLAMALICSGPFMPAWYLIVGAIVLGAFLLATCEGALTHVEKLGAATVKAGEDAAKANMPPEHAAPPKDEGKPQG